MALLLCNFSSLVEELEGCAKGRRVNLRASRDLRWKPKDHVENNERMQHKHLKQSSLWRIVGELPSHQELRERKAAVNGCQ